jgi:hypothetical protein
MCGRYNERRRGWHELPAYSKYVQIADPLDVFTEPRSHPEYLSIPLARLRTRLLDVHEERFEGMTDDTVTGRKDFVQSFGT